MNKHKWKKNKEQNKQTKKESPEIWDGEGVGRGDRDREHM